MGSQYNVTANVKTVIVNFKEATDSNKINNKG